jgi:hypothetical protein
LNGFLEKPGDTEDAIILKVRGFVGPYDSFLQKFRVGPSTALVALMSEVLTNYSV